MMLKLYIAVVLAVAVAAAEATSGQSLHAPLLPEKAEGKWGDLGITANVNDYVDETISMLVPLIQQFGLDPMDLPDVEEGFEVRYILVTYSAWLKIHDGHMSGLVNVARSGDQTVNYFAKMLRVRVELQFNDLEFVYQYLVKVMRIGPTGGIRGSLDRFKVVTDILIDFNNDEIHLQQFSMNDIGYIPIAYDSTYSTILEFQFPISGRLRVRLTGNPLTDWLVNPTIGAFVRIFDNVIIKVVEVNIRNAIHAGISFINANLRQLIDLLESYN
ncbi:hypothetical protein MSG28_000358 [Choristoneura fumiferana]|uniref:Uncharacterized protein n=1 Tax=Choristoneura fumiferana TaxID=7141 RepID=A0ACC0K0E5_CHOFU|nr:hypothetical protein MSG28_000358 [Choristoneura fumiferana]